MDAKIAVYDTRSYDKNALLKSNENFGFEFDFFDFKLTEKTVFSARGFDAVCIFVNDIANEPVIKALADEKVKLIVLRCAGFNNVDLKAAEKIWRKSPACSGLFAARGCRACAFSASFAYTAHSSGLCAYKNRKFQP